MHGALYNFSPTDIIDVERDWLPFRVILAKRILNSARAEVSYILK